jgi:CubicO group peptidase (beta-lactamase class C family)
MHSAFSSPVLLVGKPDRLILREAVNRRIKVDLDDPYRIPGANLAVSSADGSMTIVSQGLDRDGSTFLESSLFPLASASKLATGLLILRMIDNNEIGLSTPLSAVLPKAQAARDSRVTIQRLLSHTSGLPLEVTHDLSEPPGRISYTAGLAWPGALAAACLEASFTSEPGKVVQYSNIGFGLLGLVAERVGRAPFRELLQDRVFQPLRIEGYVANLPDRKPIAVSDIPSPHASSELEPYNTEIWRAVGSPWAGVTTTISGLLTLVRAYAAQSAFLSSDIGLLARSSQTEGLSGGYGTTDAFLGHRPSRKVVWPRCDWGLSVEIQGGRRPHWAPATMPRSFGQIGSSGCLAWHDPDSGISWAIMGARTTDSGWLIRHGTRIAQAALDSVRQG